MKNSRRISSLEAQRKALPPPGALEADPELAQALEELGWEGTDPLRFSRGQVLKMAKHRRGQRAAGYAPINVPHWITGLADTLRFLRLAHQKGAG